MKSMLQGRSDRKGHDGWGISYRGQTPKGWSVCTTRQECRELVDNNIVLDPWNYRIVKVKINVEAV